MSLAALTRTAFASRHGPVALWHRAEALRPGRPLVVAIASAFSPEDVLTLLPQVIGGVADVAILRLPGAGAASAILPSVTDYGEALGDVIEAAFGDRPVVLFGVGFGALVALATHAAPVQRIVAVEPPLITGKLWPILRRLRERLTAADGGGDLRPFIEGVFGLTAEALPGQNYRSLVEGSVPTDVVIGTEPLLPPRELTRLPSFLDAPEIALLTDRPGVTLHRVDGAGHDLLAAAPEPVRDVLVAACRAAAAPASDEEIDAALLGRVPLTARRVVYLGPRFSAFAGALLRRAPEAVVRDQLEGPEVDVVVAADLAGLDAAKLAGALRPDGVLVAHAPAGAPQALLAALHQAPLSLQHAYATGPMREPFMDRTGDLWPAWRRAPPAGLPKATVLVARKAPAPPPSLSVGMVTFARLLLDVRTRLPAQALRSDPDLQVSCLNSPAALPPLPVDAPKVLILQRLALTAVEAWRTAVATSIRKGWVVVLEFDDHPDLAASVLGRTADVSEWERFGYVHAVQTSTPRLAEAFRRYNPEVQVFANAAFTLPPFPSGPRPRRVGYAAVKRGGLAVEVARSLDRVSAEFPDLEYLVVGDQAVFDALPTPRKQFVDFAPYEDYLDLLGSCSISLSPLQAGAALAAKSDVKFVEASSRGVLTIASATAYEDAIRHGENGLIARRLKDWAPQLAGALRDEAWQAQMAQSAWQEVRDGRMFAHQIAERHAWYWSLWNRRDELTETLKQRLPGLTEALQA